MKDTTKPLTLPVIHANLAVTRIERGDERHFLSADAKARSVLYTAYHFHDEFLVVCPTHGVALGFRNPYNQKKVLVQSKTITALFSNKEQA